MFWDNTYRLINELRGRGDMDVHTEQYYLAGHIRGRGGATGRCLRAVERWACLVDSRGRGRDYRVDIVVAMPKGKQLASSGGSETLGAERVPRVWHRLATHVGAGRVCTRCRSGVKNSEILTNISGVPIRPEAFPLASEGNLRPLGLRRFRLRKDAP
jgi:hypothetical protein